MTPQLKTAFNTTSNNVMVLMIEIEKELKQLRKGKDKTWAHQGTMAEVETRLRSIRNFLRGE